MIELHVHDSKNPTFSRVVGAPDKKIEEIMTNDASAINFARAVLKQYETISEHEFWAIHKGHRFYLSTQEENQAMREIVFNFALCGEYEPETTKLIEREVKAGDNCVDVGASIGYLTLLMARQTGDTGHVYSFEPTANQFEYLKKNIEINGYKDVITAHNLGAWGSETELPIVLKTNLGADALSKVIPLDSVLPEKIDFIKIDVDGAEPEVLKGLEKTIQKNPQLKMIIEFYPEYIKKLGLDPQDVLDFLDKYFTYEKIPGDYTDQYWNYYCVRKVV